MGGLLVARRVVGSAIDLQQHKARRVILLLDHIEADDARLLHAMLRVIERSSFEGLDSVGLDMDEDVDDEHKASFSHAVVGCFGLEYSID